LTGRSLTRILAQTESGDWRGLAHEYDAIILRDLWLAWRSRWRVLSLLRRAVAGYLGELRPTSCQRHAAYRRAYCSAGDCWRLCRRASYPRSGLSLGHCAAHCRSADALSRSYADIQKWWRWRQGQAKRHAATYYATNAYEQPNPANSHADYIEWWRIKIGVTRSMFRPVPSHVASQVLLTFSQ
jgi:hypothetical protein